MVRRLFGCLLAAALAWMPCAQADVQVRDVPMEIGENGVSYPQLEGMADENIQKAINDDIVLSGSVTAHILTLSTLGQSAWGLRVTYTSHLDAAVFSVAISAKGKQPGGRDGHSYAAMTYDLATGRRATLEQVFTDPEQAVAFMEETAESTLGPELSDYMEQNQLAPLPKDSFCLDGDGITFYYPAEQFSYISGYAGSCQFTYEELTDFLRTDADALPARMGVLPKENKPEEQGVLIRTDASAGQLPHVPVTLGQPMPQVVAAYRLVRTPDAFPGGRYFVLEDAAFRGVLLISDNMETGYERSVVKGIQAKRGGLHGLLIGKANREDVLAVLGQPDETIVFTEGMAYDYNLPVGQSDVYRCGTYELRLHTDENGTLRCVQLGM